MNFRQFISGGWHLTIVLFGLAASCTIPGCLKAQDIDSGYSRAKPFDHDSLYIETFPGMFTARLFLSQKTTNFSITNNKEELSLDYLPNTNLNLGIGATVGPFSLNLAFGFKFLNPDEGQGKTRYLDLQSHVYTRKFVVDFFGQFYKGMYLQDTHSLSPEYPEPYYVRPDIYEQILGLSTLYVFNHKKYSYRAALIQDERQLKSAGSFLAGLEVYYGLVQGDSSLVPSFLDDSAFVELQGYERLSFFKVGPSAGYAYTVVVAKKYFAMASLTINMGLAQNSAYLPGKGTAADFQIDMSAFFRFAIGYNDANWYLGISAVNNQIGTSTDSRLFNADYGIGNVRLNFVKRFRITPKMRSRFRILQ